MCGIAGVVSFGGGEPPTEELLRAMCDQIVHRGPDDHGCDVCDGVGLGMRRLSIIDLAGGHQPIFNEDGTVRVVYNGEIYNYRELRHELEERGHRFRTASDTEVIVHLWEEHGADFPKRLNGMFAIALYDSRQRRILLARDHVGIKPLFYAITDSHLVFGSEIKVLLTSGLIPRELDLTALGEFMAWEYVPGRGTLIRSVRKLEAAHTLEVQLRSPGEAPTIRVQQFWNVPDPPSDPPGQSDDAWADDVDEAIHRSVERQLVSDVPLGAFLSGGVDSSLVVAAMGDAQTFSIGFDDPTYNELAWARRVADHLGVSHDFEVIQPTVVDMFDDLMNFMDDPIGDFSIFPTYLVSRHARKSVTVALSGDGGDELFGGYETYLAQDKARLWRRVPRFLRAGVAEPVIRALRPTAKKKGLINKAKRFVEGLEHQDALGHARWRMFVGESLRHSLFTAEAQSGMAYGSERHILELREEAAFRDELDQSLYIDFRSYLVDNCLVKVDRMSMACSLETRVPLLDKDLVELAFRVPSNLKVSGGQTKDLLKRVAARHVPKGLRLQAQRGLQHSHQALAADRVPAGHGGALVALSHRGRWRFRPGHRCTPQGRASGRRSESQPRVVVDARLPGLEKPLGRLGPGRSALDAQRSRTREVDGA